MVLLLSALTAAQAVDSYRQTYVVPLSVASNVQLPSDSLATFTKDLGTELARTKRFAQLKMAKTDRAGKDYQADD